MFKSIPLGACLVCMAALIGSGAVSARAGDTSVLAPSGQPSEFRVLTSSTPNLVEGTLSQTLRSALGAVSGAQSADSGLTLSASLIPTIWSGQMNSGYEGQNNDNQGDHRGGNDGDKGDHRGGNDGDKDKDHHAPAPTPEPSTLLSFGAALIIGGGVLLLGRLRKERR